MSLRLENELILWVGSQSKKMGLNVSSWIRNFLKKSIENGSIFDQKIDKKRTKIGLEGSFIEPIIENQFLLKGIIKSTIENSDDLIKNAREAAVRFLSDLGVSSAREGTGRISFNIESELLDLLKKEAQKKLINVSELVRFLILKSKNDFDLKSSNSSSLIEKKVFEQVVFSHMLLEEFVKEAYEDGEKIIVDSRLKLSNLIEKIN